MTSTTKSVTTNEEIAWDEFESFVAKCVEPKLVNKLPPHPPSPPPPRPLYSKINDNINYNMNKRPYDDNDASYQNKRTYNNKNNNYNNDRNESRNHNNYQNQKQKQSQNQRQEYKNKMDGSGIFAQRHNFLVSLEEFIECVRRAALQSDDESVLLRSTEGYSRLYEDGEVREFLCDVKNPNKPSNITSLPSSSLPSSSSSSPLEYGNLVYFPRVVVIRLSPIQDLSPLLRREFQRRMPSHTPYNKHGFVYLNIKDAHHYAQEMWSIHREYLRLSHQFGDQFTKNLFVYPSPSSSSS